MNYVKNDVVIIDSGSYSMKVGLSTQKEPFHFFPTLVGRPNIPGLIYGFNQNVKIQIRKPLWDIKWWTKEVF